MSIKLSKYVHDDYFQIFKHYRGMGPAFFRFQLATFLVATLHIRCIGMAAKDFNSEMRHFFADTQLGKKTIANYLCLGRQVAERISANHISELCRTATVQQNIENVADYLQFLGIESWPSLHSYLGKRTQADRATERRREEGIPCRPLRKTSIS